MTGVPNNLGHVQQHRPNARTVDQESTGWSACGRGESTAHILHDLNTADHDLTPPWDFLERALAG